jgi:predicted DCC family thiol-disulfide oxidoreductase YuxK
MIALYRLCRSDSVFVISQVTVVTQIKTKSEPASTQIVVLYDGQCNFCTGQVKNLERLDGRGRLRFISLHDPVVARDYPDLSFQQLMDQMWVVAYDGRKYGGADAIRYLSRQLPMLWPLAPLMHVPGTMPIWRYLYRQIAKRRYKIAGRNCDEGGTCSLHQ